MTVCLDSATVTAKMSWTVVSSFLHPVHPVHPVHFPPNIFAGQEKRVSGTEPITLSTGAALALPLNIFRTQRMIVSKTGTDASERVPERDGSVPGFAAPIEKFRDLLHEGPAKKGTVPARGLARTVPLFASLMLRSGNVRTAPLRAICTSPVQAISSSAFPCAIRLRKYPHFCFGRLRASSGHRRFR